MQLTSPQIFSYSENILLTDLGESAEKIYEMYKRRKEIEGAFDTLKDTLEVDKTGMQNREKLLGYLFILFLGLHLYTQILVHLRRKELLEKYSVHNVP
ncbi:MAG: transposase [Thermoplasmata archaeon]